MINIGLKQLTDILKSELLTTRNAEVHKTLLKNQQKKMQDMLSEDDYEFEKYCNRVIHRVKIREEQIKIEN